MTDFSVRTEDQLSRQIHPALFNTAKDGSGTWYVPLLDSDGQVIISPLALSAGTARIGTVSGVLKQVITTKAIDASLGAYAVGDVVNDDDCSTTATCWTFADVARVDGGYGYIVDATIFSDSEGIVPELTLLLFNATPTGQLTDNSANSNPDPADRLKWVGYIEFPAMEGFCCSASVALVSPSTVGHLPLAFKCAAADTSLYGVLYTKTAFTQVATDDITIALLVEQY